MGSKHFIAGLDDSGCLIHDCGHRHKTPEAAHRCGEKKWVSRDGKSMAAGWRSGGVYVGHPGQRKYEKCSRTLGGWEVPEPADAVTA